MMLGTPEAWWGWALIAIGATSGVLGVLFALAQHDLKRLLAYHSVENIGIILLGIGVGVLGLATGLPALAVIGFAAGLLHVVNHCYLQGAVVPRRRRGAARRAHARPRGARRPAQADEVDRNHVSDRFGRNCRVAAAQRLRQRVPALHIRLRRGRSPAGGHRHGGIDRDRRHGADQRPCRRLLRQGLRYRVSRFAAQPGSGRGP